MGIRIQLESDDDDNEQSEDTVEDEHQTVTGWFLGPDNVGGVFIRATLVFTAVTILSMIGLVVLLLSISEEPFVDTPTVEDPVIGYIWLFSYTAAVLSVSGYAAWSYLEQRRLKNQMTNDSASSLIKKPIRTFQIVFGDGDDLNEYEKRVQKTVFALLIAVIFGNLPIRLSLNVLLAL